ncbi:hypothetical protein [Haladaptatus sp. CMSO5]|uniref:hypothetical protein n=1 Tax=Haladaptatus sp. CMSO5 TaxID=3120514 RepID=UPI002FCE0387
MLRLNKHLFTETKTDSGALTVLGTLIHRFTSPGEYLVAVSRAGKPVGQRLIVVDAQYHSMRAVIDLASITEGSGDTACSCEPETFDCIRPDGYAIFHVSRGRGGYAVTISSLTDDKGDQGDKRTKGDKRDTRTKRNKSDGHEFDSATLTEYDTVSVTLFRPGTYALRNELTEHEVTVEVSYPDGERPGEPVRVTCTDRGFSPDGITLAPAQGLVVDIETKARVTVTLREPHKRATAEVSGDRPPRGARTRAGRPSVDPRKHSVDRLKRELAHVDRPSELRLIHAIERTSRNRSDARTAIEERLRAVNDRN